MNFVSRNQVNTVIRQIPLMLLGATAIFSLPFLAFWLIHMVRGTDAEGKYSSLVFGLLSAGYYWNSSPRVRRWRSVHGQRL